MRVVSDKQITHSRAVGYPAQPNASVGAPIHEPPAQWNVDYAHLSEACVRVDDLVVTGDQVGLMGRMGYENSIYPTHVHVQVWRFVNGQQGFVMPSWKEY